MDREYRKFMDLYYESLEEDNVNKSMKILEDLGHYVMNTYPYIQWGKLCFFYCGPELCNCGNSEEAREIKGEEI
jgi:hypothetical protein